MLNFFEKIKKKFKYISIFILFYIFLYILYYLNYIYIESYNQFIFIFVLIPFILYKIFKSINYIYIKVLKQKVQNIKQLITKIWNFCYKLFNILLQLYYLTNSILKKNAHKNLSKKNEFIYWQLIKRWKRRKLFNKYLNNLKQKLFKFKLKKKITLKKELFFYLNWLKKKIK